MLQLNNLESLTKSRKRVGRGGSRGGTSGRGHKGQRARSGGKSELRPFFEGGQMSLTRRLPRRGFNNARFAKQYYIISLTELDKHFNNDDVVSLEALQAKGLGRGHRMVKVLANGELSKKITVQVHACTKGAQEAIQKSGGSVVLVKENEGDRPTQ